MRESHFLLSVKKGSLWLSVALIACAVGVGGAAAQSGTNQVVIDPGSGQAGSNASSNAPLTITLQDALQRARVNSPEFRAALTELGLAKEDKVQSRAALLPGVDYNTSFLYTQGNGTPAARYIANNGVHEYISQANAHEAISLAGVADYRRTVAAEAVARARSEIAARGLVVTVTQSYYELVAAGRKYATAQRAATEAQRFFNISQKLEHGGEVAHSDVVKAQIQYQQQQRDLREAELAMNRSRLELAVLLFPDFNQNFTVVDDLQAPQAVPPIDEVRAMAGRKNPQLRAALATLEEAHHEVTAAWGGFLPALSVDYFYGIDANHFATRTDGVRNLGYAAVASLQFPIWSWGTNRSKLKQADLRQTQARLELTFAQKKLLSDLQSFYQEVEASRAELESLTGSAELATESLRLTNLRYQAGEATVLEVVDAQNTLTQALHAADDGQVRYRVSIANLQTLTGSF
jgi:outer membrane protein TolC